MKVKRIKNGCVMQDNNLLIKLPGCAGFFNF